MGVNVQATRSPRRFAPRDDRMRTHEGPDLATGRPIIRARPTGADRIAQVNCIINYEAISLLVGAEWPILRRVQQRQELFHQGLDIVQAFRYLESRHRVLVEVLVEVGGGAEQAANIAVAGFRPEPADCDEVVSVSAVFPTALFSDGLEDLDSSAPAFLRCLRQVTVGQFSSGLLQEMLAG